MRLSDDLEKMLDTNPVELHVFKRCDFGMLSKLVFNRTVATYSPYLYELTKDRAVEIVFVKFVNADRVLRVFRDKNNNLDSRWVSKVPELFEVSRALPELKHIVGANISSNKGVRGCVVDDKETLV